MYGNSYGMGMALGNSVGYLVTIILFSILAVAGGIVIQVVFLSKKNEGRFTGFLGWLYKFLSFKTWLIEVIIKVLYLIQTLYVIFFGLVMLFTNFGLGLLLIILGPIVVRIVYEISLLFVMLCFNVSDINNKLGKGKAPAAPFEQNAPRTAPAQAHRVTPVGQPVHQAGPVQQATPVHQAKPVEQPVRVCSNCGAKLSDDSVFCSECGTKNA